MKDHVFTLGIEEEFQIIDPETRELRSHIQQILAHGKVTMQERVKPEMHQSVVELGTDICYSTDDAREHVRRLRSQLASLAARAGLKIASAGTHPFSHWMDQPITAGERYEAIVKDMQQVARANLIFGLHVHVGIPDRNVAIHVMNQARYFLPHLFALSVNSPFWLGQNTGFKAYRLKIFERFPRTGIPDAFESLSEYEDYLKLLVTTNCVDNAKKIWWDIRLHPFFDTIEFRICDAQSRMEDTIALAALMQAIIVRLHKLQHQNMTFRIYRRRLIDENRWRASRYGLDGKLIDFGRECEVETRSLIHEIIEFVEKEVEELGSQRCIQHIGRIMGEGTGADRQLAVWEATKSMPAVVDQIVQETYEGLETVAPPSASTAPASMSVQRPIG
ncbi:MAG TPA: carboxylate-amine ligase [Chthoniobacterales bacterium]|nr:carboxylate-amine ligase [Chthoniobacterales bacterium]